MFTLYRPTLSAARSASEILNYAGGNFSDVLKFDDSYAVYKFLCNQLQRYSFSFQECSLQVEMLINLHKIAAKKGFIAPAVEVDCGSIEQFFNLTNIHAEQPDRLSWAENKEVKVLGKSFFLSSCSVGDIVVKGDQCWVCLSYGWHQAQY